MFTDNTDGCNGQTVERMDGMRAEVRYGDASDLKKNEKRSSELKFLFFG